MIRESMQHIDDIDIPAIEITAGWAAKDVSSLQDCDDAFAYLMSACAQIDFQVDMELTKPKDQQDGSWLARARCALKYKKAALQIVQQRRAVIGNAESRAWQDSRDRKLLEFIRANTSDEQFMLWLRGSGIMHNVSLEAA